MFEKAVATLDMLEIWLSQTSKYRVVPFVRFKCCHKDNDQDTEEFLHHSQNL